MDPHQGPLGRRRPALVDVVVVVAVLGQPFDDEAVLGAFAKDAPDQLRIGFFFKLHTFIEKIHSDLMQDSLSDRFD